MKKTTLTAPLGRWVAGVWLAVVATTTAPAQGPTFVSTNPAANSASAGAGGLGVQFGVAPPLGATAGQGLKVFSSQRGGQRAGNSGTVSNPSSSQLSFVPTGYDFQPGETVQVSLTSGVVANTGTGLAPPKVVQYTTATGGSGRGAFRPGSPVPTPANPTYVRTADFNNDGHLDALVTTANTTVAALHLGTGTGAFGAGTALPAVGLYPYGTLAVGDMDNDGDLDVVQSDGGSSGVLQTLRNNGSGTFTAAPGTAINFGAQRIALGDLDGDGDLDAVVNAEQSGLVNIRLNDGTGVFDNPNYPGGVLLPNLHNVIDLALADVDNDYDLDIVTVAGQGNGGYMTVELNVLLNGGDASGSNTGTFSVNAGEFYHLTLGSGVIMPRMNLLAVGDVDGDGDADLAVALAGVVAAPSGVVLLNGSGTGSAGTTAVGTFGASRAVALAPFTRDIALADADADGDLDVLSAGADVSTGGNGRLYTTYNAGPGTFNTTPLRQAALGTGTINMAVADLDHDNDLDVLTANYTAGTLSVRLNGPGPELNVRQGPTTYLTGSTYNFGNLVVGNFVGLVYTLHNLSPTDTLHMSGVGQSSTGLPANTGLVGGYATTNAPFVIAPGDSSLLTVTASPPAVGLQTSQFIIVSDDFDEPIYELNMAANGIAAPATTVVWTGAVSTDWATAGNWNPAQVPDATTSVRVPPSARQPAVSQPGAACAALQTDGGTTLTIVPGGHLLVLDYLQANGAVAMTGGTLEDRAPATNFDGGFTASGGTVLFSGPALQNVSIPGNLALWNLTIGPRSSNTVYFQNPPYVRRVLRLNGPMEPGVVLGSDASGTAMVVQGSGGQVIGNAVMWRYIGGPNAGLGYRHFSTPMFRSAVSNFFAPAFTPVLNAAYNTVGNTATPFPTFFGYDESRQGAAGVPGPAGFDQGWFSPATATTLLDVGRGHTVNLAGAQTMTVVGGLNTGPTPVGPLSRSGTGPFAGYHLLGNPYPAPIDWDNVTKPAGLDDAVYVFRSTGQYAGFYDSYVNGLGTLAGGEIAAMQGFFVRVSQPVPAFAFTDAARLTTYSNPTFRRGAADARPVLALALRPAGGGVSAEADKAFIYFEAGATAALDARFDAPKLPNPGGLGLASALGGQAYAINGLPPLGAAPLLLPLAVSAPAAGRYELAVDQLLNFGPGTALYLRDALLGTLTRLTASTRYAFGLSGTTAPGRFAVEFRPAGALASAGQVLEAQVQVWPNPAAAGVGVAVAAPAGAVVTLLNALGQVVRPAATASAAGLALPTAGLAPGLYVLRVRAGAGEVSRRLLVR